MNPEGSPSGRLQASVEGDMGTPVSPTPHPTLTLFYILVVEKSVTTFVTVIFFQ